MRKAMQIGCSDYLIKPIDTDEMTAVLEKAVEKIQKKFQKDEKEKKLFPRCNENFVFRRAAEYY